MPRQMRVILAAASLLAVGAVAAAQTADQPAPQSAIQQQQAAPIQRAYPNDQYPYPSGPAPRAAGAEQMGPVTIAPGETVSPGNEATATPIRGVLLRIGANGAVREVSAGPGKLELSVERGIANVNVHDPAKDVLILVDLPGGQTQLLKNGLYTFNAQSNTARVLKGEALAFPGSAYGSTGNAGQKPLKVKEDKMVAFGGTKVKAEGFGPFDATADLLPGPMGPGYAGGYGGGYPYGYGPYGDGFYGAYPYWAYDYPYYPYGYYPYGWYPWGVGLGFGYYGGWGGFHGGWGGGFHGGGFHGRR